MSASSSGARSDPLTRTERIPLIFTAMLSNNFLEAVTRIIPWARAERYRVACLYEYNPPRDAQLSRHWPKLFPALDLVVRAMPYRCYLRSVQYNPEVAAQDDEKGSVIRFPKLTWSEANNRKWVDDLEKRAAFELDVTEFWSPWQKDLEDRRGGPDLYMKLNAASECHSPAPEYEWQSLTIAIKHDLLGAVKPQVQNVLARAGELMTRPQLLVFDRTWAERGKYTSFIRTNGLEDSHPDMLARWCDIHPEVVLPRFDA